MPRYLISREIAGKSATAFEHLRRMALEGELPLGERLAPQDLANAFGVSASPIRDALMRLSAEGLVDWRMSQGFFGKRFEVEEQRQLHELLLVLIGSALDTLAQIAPGKALGPLIELDDSQVLSAKTLEDHLRTLVSATGNRVLAQTAGSLIDRTHLPRRIDLETTTRPEVTAGLRAIGQALVNGHGAKARSAAAQLVEDRIARLPSLVDQANARSLRAKLP